MQMGFFSWERKQFLWHRNDFIKLKFIAVKFVLLLSYSPHSHIIKRTGVRFYCQPSLFHGLTCGEGEWPECTPGSSALCAAKQQLMIRLSTHAESSLHQSNTNMDDEQRTFAPRWIPTWGQLWCPLQLKYCFECVISRNACTSVHSFLKKEVNDIWDIWREIGRDSINVCSTRGRAEHLMNLCSLIQTWSWVASTRSSSIFHYSGESQLAVLYRCLLFLYESHICCGARFSFFPLHVLILTCCRSNGVIKSSRNIKNVK